MFTRAFEILYGICGWRRNQYKKGQNLDTVIKFIAEIIYQKIFYNDISEV